MKKLYLVDVSSLFFRAFFAIRSLSSPTGMPTNALYGFLSMILKLIREQKPDLIVFCHDLPTPSFRKEIYSEYKAHRSEVPEDLVPQFPYLKKIADFMGIPAVEKDLFEADDLIGTLVEIGKKNNCEVYIVSGDKDFGQLIQNHVFLYDTMKEVVYDPPKVKEKWGILPESFLDYLSLVGDTSDNVPGVHGIGPKGAIKLLEQFGTLEKLFDGIDQVENKKLREKLMNGKANAFLSKQLCRIKIDVPIDQELSHYEMRPFKKQEMLELLRELNFKSLEKQIETASPFEYKSNSNVNLIRPPDFTGPPKEIDSNDSSNEISNGNSIEKVIEKVIEKIDEKFENFSLKTLDEWKNLGQPVWIFDFESKLYMSLAAHKTSETSAQHGNSFGIKGYQIKKMLHKVLNVGLQPAPQLEMNLESTDVGVAEVPSADQIQWLEKSAVLFDLELAAYVLDPGENLSIENLSGRYLAGTTLSGPAKSPSEFLSQIKALEVKISSLIQDRQLKSVFKDLDLPLVDVLLRMERRGVQVDQNLLKIQSLELQGEIQQIEKQIFEITGETFNVASPKQLAQIMFEKMKIPTGKKTKTGFSTDTEVLEKLQKDYPIAKLMLEFRECSKLKSTYVDALGQWVGADGRLHTTFHQALTSTGRLSSTEPNLQNIPIRSARGTRIRRAFTAAEGKKIMSIDYSQIELRILAHIADDENMIQAFLNDLDIHSITASEIFSTPISTITPEMRRTAKAVNFGIAYGQGAFGLSDTLSISRSEGQAIITKYFERFKGVQNYMQKTIQDAHEKGYAETLFGRRRYIKELKSQNGAVRKAGERAAINAPIQGTAADLVKKSMILLDQQIDVPMVLQIHDELLFEDTEEKLLKSQQQIVHIMENVMKLKVPLKVSVGIGPNWEQAH